MEFKEEIEDEQVICGVLEVEVEFKKEKEEEEEQEEEEEEEEHLLVVFEVAVEF